jgi:hypothetical protein
MSGAATVGPSQTVTISASVSYSLVTVDASGTLDVTGTGVTATLGALTTNGGDVFDVANGATMVVVSYSSTSGANESGIGNNGALEIDAGVNLSSFGAINFDDSGGAAATPIISAGASADELSLSAVSAGDTLDLLGQTVASATWVENTVGVVTETGGVLTFDPSGGGSEPININSCTYTGANFQTSGSDVTSARFSEATIIETQGGVCFAEGTLIETQAGPIAVENLRKSDMVLLAAGGTRPVKWIGWRCIDLARHANPDSVRPVRILADAIADGVPRRDLLVSPDHALFIDGKLIPARLVCNGATILEDHQCRTMTYYHVELDAHDVLLAEGLPAESYLDTGNRIAFANSGIVTLLSPEFNPPNEQARREAESRAPLICDAARVEPVWQIIARRAESRGFTLPTFATTDDPEVRIVADGKRFMPISQDGRRYTFVLPKIRGEVRLSSRSGIPSMTRPWIEDRRRLGVCVSRIVVRSANEYQDIPVDHPGLSKGWWGIETAGAAMLRWTDGDAVVPLPTTADQATMLELKIAGTMSYVVDVSDGHQAALTARRECRAHEV